MSSIRSFRDLEVWQAAMELAVAAHIVASSLPAEHRFELASQMRKAAVSIPSNIAEGHAQQADKVFLRHVRIALGSLAELESQTELAVRLNLLKALHLSQLPAHLSRTGQLLHGIRRSLLKRISIEQSRRSNK